MYFSAFPLIPGVLRSPPDRGVGGSLGLPYYYEWTYTLRCTTEPEGVKGEIRENVEFRPARSWWVLGGCRLFGLGDRRPAGGWWTGEEGGQRDCRAGPPGGG